MRVARILNAIFWLYIWLSDALMPVTGSGDFWAAKGRQLFRLNSNFNDPPRLIGSTITILVLWFVIDWALRRVSRRRTKAAG
jgi:hypothetical protein